MIDKKIGIYIVIILVLLVSLINIATIVTLTGKVISSTQGQTSICNNNPPVLPTITTQSGHFNTQFNLHINGTDYQTLTYYDNVSIFNINSSTGMINFTPFRTDNARYHVLITASDSPNNCPLNETISFILDINNSLPIFPAAILNQSWEENTLLTGLDLDDYFSDPDNDILNYTYTITDYENDLIGGVINISINNLPGNINHGKVIFTPRTNWYGTAYIVFTANDSVNLSYSNNITLNVTTNRDITIPNLIINSNSYQNHSKLWFKLNTSLTETGSILYSLNNQSNRTVCTSCNGSESYINITNFGTHNLTVYGIDTSGNTNVSFITMNIVSDSDGDGIPDTNETDADADSIADSVDVIIGNISNIFTDNIPSLRLKIDGSENIAQQYTGNITFNITNSTHSLVEFTYNTDKNITLNLANIILTKQPSQAVNGSILISGLNLTIGATKTLYLDSILHSNRTCIKDAEINSISQIGSSCNGASEFIIACPGSNESYTCADVGYAYKITGLNHSGAVEITAVSSPEIINESSSSSSSGGGGSSSSSLTTTPAVPASEQQNPTQTPETPKKESHFLKTPPPSSESVSESPSKPSSAESATKDLTTGLKEFAKSLSGKAFFTDLTFGKISKVYFVISIFFIVSILFIFILLSLLRKRNQNKKNNKNIKLVLNIPKRDINKQLKEVQIKEVQPKYVPKKQLQEKLVELVINIFHTLGIYKTPQEHEYLKKKQQIKKNEQIKQEKERQKIQQEREQEKIRNQQLQKKEQERLETEKRRQQLQREQKIQKQQEQDKLETERKKQLLQQEQLRSEELKNTAEIKQTEKEREEQKLALEQEQLKQNEKELTLERERMYEEDRKRHLELEQKKMLRTFKP